jgi:hypothetical protein
MERVILIVRNGQLPAARAERIRYAAPDHPELLTADQQSKLYHKTVKRYHDRQTKLKIL